MNINKKLKFINQPETTLFNSIYINTNDSSIGNSINPINTNGTIVRDDNTINNYSNTRGNSSKTSNTNNHPTIQENNNYSKINIYQHKPGFLKSNVVNNNLMKNNKS